MTRSFKRFSELYDIELEQLSEEQLDELFGIFRNNKKIEDAKKKKAEYDEKRKASMKKRDDLWAKRKAEVEKNNGGFNPLERGSLTTRSQQASGRAAERDWVRNIGEEAELEEGKQITGFFTMDDIHHIEKLSIEAAKTHLNDRIKASEHLATPENVRKAYAMVRAETSVRKLMLAVSNFMLSFGGLKVVK